LLLLTSMVALLVVLGYKAFSEPTIFRLRNFYGAYRIQDEPSNKNIPGGIRKFWHGRTVHGSQILHQDLRLVPTEYYGIGSGISDTFEIITSPRRVGVIGLGCGVVSAYVKAKDTITFFEIDPDVGKIARQWFTYLDDCEGRVQTFFGDGRLFMQNGEKSTNNYDVILVDAFSGDGIPTHLLTREAVEVYLSRLSESGVILFHISNRYYDLRPVLKAAASELKLLGAVKDDTRATHESYQCRSIYMAITKSPERLESLLQRDWRKLENGDGLKEAKAWTDDHINIVSSLNIWTDGPLNVAAGLKQKFISYWENHLTR